MAEEHAEMDDAELGGGGYVDDDIDVDDEDGAVEVEVKAEEKGKDPRDYVLRAVGGMGREYVVARFLTRRPDLDAAGGMRLFRDGEGTERGRKEGIERDRKQHLYYNSFSGRRRQERYKTQGLVSIPDRFRKGWTMEVMPSGHKPLKGPNPPEGEEVETDMDVYKGSMDGKTPSSYAIMVLNEDNRTVDVIPVGSYSWFSFRPERKRVSANVAEDAEARMAKRLKKDENRLNRFQAKYEGAQERIEQNLGGFAREDVAHEKVATIGIRRRVKPEQQDGEDEEGREGLDFDQEFDNDDVAQIDRDDVEKTTDSRDLGDAKRNAIEFRKMIKDEIKDEPVQSRPGSPGSESDEDPQEQSRSASPSPSRPPTGSRSPSPPRSQRGANVPGGSAPPSRMPTPMMASTSSRTGTPQRQDLAHLLPPSGTLPTARHVTAVLSSLLKQRKNVLLKDALQFFERNTAQQKKNLIDIMRKVGQLTELPAGSNTYYVALKTPTSSPGR